MTGGATARSPGVRGRRAPVWLSTVAIAAALLVNLPLVYLVVRASDGGPEALLRDFRSAAVLRAVGDTLALTAGVVLVTLALALPLAWLVTRTDLPGRRAWAVLLALPLVVPSYVAAFALVAVAGPNGWAQELLAPLGVTRLPEIAYGYTGALVALGLYTYPYVYLPLVAALRGLDPALEESARSLGLRPREAFRRVVLPRLRPALLAGTLLVALYALSDFGAVSIVRYNTLTLGIYNAYTGMLDRGVAARLSVALVLLTCGMIALQTLLLRSARAGDARPVRPSRVLALGPLRWPAVIGVATLVGVALLPPIGVTLGWGIGTASRSAALAGVLGAVAGSLGASGLAALGAVIVALPLAAWSVRHPGPLSRGAERLSYVGHALPGLVIALALVFLATRALRPLYQTLALLVLAYVVRFLPEALATIHAALAGVAPAYEEAARGLGRRPFATFRAVTLPLIRPGVLAGAGLVFLSVMKELPATLILRPIGFETLATRIWSATAEGLYSDAALPALALLVATAPPVHLLIIRPMLAERARP